MASERERYVSLVMVTLIYALLVSVCVMALCSEDFHLLLKLFAVVVLSFGSLWMALAQKVILNG